MQYPYTNIYLRWHNDVGGIAAASRHQQPRVNPDLGYGRGGVDKFSLRLCGFRQDVQISSHLLKDKLIPM